MATINDWIFAIATASVPILTFVVTMYLLLKIHFLSEGIAKLEAMHAQQNHEIIELAKSVAALQAVVKHNERQ